MEQEGERMKLDEVLKPCPKCGWKPEGLMLLWNPCGNHPWRSWFITCPHCGHNGKIRSTQKDAACAWNEEPR